MDGSMDGRVECRVLRRSGGGREVAELEVWMDGRVEGRVLRRSGGGREVAEVEVWMDGRMECVVLTRSRSKWRRQRGDGVEEEVNGGDGLHHQTANREWGGRFAVPRSTLLLCAMRHLNFSQKGKFTPHTTHHTPHIQPYPTTTCYTTHQV